MMQQLDSEDDWSEPLPILKSSALVDFDILMKIDAPKNLGSDQDELILETALATVVSQALFDHESWWSFRWPLFYAARETFKEFPPFVRDSEDKDRREYKIEIDYTGRFTDIPMEINGLPTLHDTVKYHGCVAKSTIVLDHCTTTYLSPAVLNGNNGDTVFNKHQFRKVHFPKTTSYVGNNLCGIFEVHKERKMKAFNPNLAWSLAFSSVRGTPRGRWNVDKSLLNSMGM